MERLGQQQEEEGGSASQLIVSVDCSPVRNNASLLFQLAVSRRREPPGSTGGLLERLLFAEPMGGRPVLEIPIRTLLADEPADDERRLGGAKIATVSAEQLKNDQEQVAAAAAQSGAIAVAAAAERKREAASAEQQWAEKIITLDEQVRLLNELVFTIRASNLVRSSEPRAILGSQLELRLTNASGSAALNPPPTPREALADYDMIADGGGAWRRPLARSQRPAGDSPQTSSLGVGQVSRSTNQEGLAAFEPEGAGAPAGPPGRRNGSSRFVGAPPSGSRTGQELGVTIAALCGLAVLSALTLVLIVLVLRARNGAHPSGRKAPKGERAQPKRVTFCRSSENRVARPDDQPAAAIGPDGLELEQMPDKKLLLAGQLTCLEAAQPSRAQLTENCSLATLDFMAPAKDLQRRELSGSLGRPMALYPLNGSDCARPAARYTPAGPQGAAPLGLAKETIYVIADAGQPGLGSLLSRHARPEEDEEEEESLQSSVPIMCAAHDEHLLAAGERKLVGANGAGSYCSSSTCNSSSTHCDELNTLTSARLANTGSATSTERPASGQLRLCGSFKEANELELDLLDCYTDEDLGAAGFGFGAVPSHGGANPNRTASSRDNCNNVYLFSFL